MSDKTINRTHTGHHSPNGFWHSGSSRNCGKVSCWVVPTMTAEDFDRRWNDVTDVPTPTLVREYVAHRCADARGETVTAESHNRLGTVVDELRSRNVLD